MIAVGFLAAFIWAVRTGQYEDTCTPAMRLLLDEPKLKKPDAEHENLEKPNLKLK